MRILCSIAHSFVICDSDRHILAIPTNDLPRVHPTSARNVEDINPKAVQPGASALPASTSSAFVLEYLLTEGINLSSYTRDSGLNVPVTVPGCCVSLLLLQLLCPPLTTS